MATAGTILFELKIAVEIVLAEDGKYYVDATSTKTGEIVREWTEEQAVGARRLAELREAALASPMARADIAVIPLVRGAYSATEPDPR